MLTVRLMAHRLYPMLPLDVQVDLGSEPVEMPLSKPLHRHSAALRSALLCV